MDVYLSVCVNKFFGIIQMDDEFECIPMKKENNKEYHQMINA